MLKFAAFLRDKGLAPRSCWNKFNVTMLFLKAQSIRGIVGKNDWPKYVEEEPEVYEKEDLEKLFAACTPDERLLFQFYQQTGLREQEYKEREIPIPQTLVEVEEIGSSYY